MRRCGPLRRAVIGLGVLALVAALGACGSDEPGADGAAPGGVGPGATAGGTVAPPVGVTSLDGLSLRLTEVADLGSAPTSMTSRPGTSSLYVTEQRGVVRRIDVSGSGGAATYRVADEAVLDLTGVTSTDGERGLLGLAFSADGGHLYVHYTADEDGRITVDEYAMDGDRADAGSRRNLLAIEHPRTNHNGGQLQLGPDGFLYVAVGDGGGGGDPDGNGQDPTTLLGAVLRIDPTGRTGDRPYAIPPGNPYADGGDGAPEVWTWGLRNPWRFSFDRTTGDLWIADVGQNAYEEINFLAATAEGAGRGANLGWAEMEGAQPYRDGSPPPDYTPPIFDYGRDRGECSVTGGYVYRGPDPDWQGVYVYTDYCVPELRLLVRRADGTVAERGTGVSAGGSAIPAFGEAADGTLYALGAEGGIFRIDRA